jgi:hypothetical protein
VTAVQVAIWNRGKESIQQGDILQPITIYTDPPSPILEASVIRESRDVIGLVLGNSSSSSATNAYLNSGELPVSWRILEKNDGSSIQLIYLGSDSVTISVKGVVEGSGAPKRLEVGVKPPQSPYREAYVAKRLNTIWGIVWVSLGVIFMVLVLFDVVRQRGFLRGDYVMSLVIVGLMGYGIWALFRPGPMLPPFGF